MRFLYALFIGLAASSLAATSNVPLNSDQAIVKKLTLEQKIGQLIMMAVPINDADPQLPAKLEKWHWHPNSGTEYARQLLEKYHIGSVLFIMDGTIASQVEVTNYLNKHNPSDLPLLFAADFEPGLNFSRISDSVALPRAGIWHEIIDCYYQSHPQIVKGSKEDKAHTLFFELGKTLGRQASYMGVQIVFAPVVDVNSNPNNPVINTRAFGCTPEKVIECAIPFMQGLENEGILPVIKHAPGHGDTTADSHYDLPVVKKTRKQLDQIELKPFKTLIKKGAPAVMTGHLLVPAIDSQLPCSISADMIQGLLQKEFGFDGLVFCDALNMRALKAYGTSGELAVQAFKAGTHQLVGPYDVPMAYDALLAAVHKGEISVKELDARVAKIVRYKCLLQKPEPLDAQQAKKMVTSADMHLVIKRLRDLAEAAEQKEK